MIKCETTVKFRNDIQKEIESRYQEGWNLIGISYNPPTYNFLLVFIKEK